MEVLFLKLVNMSLTASWLVLAVIAVRLVFRKTPKWILCLLWGLVALRLICPFSIESALSLIPSAEPLPQEMIYTAHPEIQSGIIILDEAVNPILESSLTPMEPASANPTQIWSFILSQVWILGMVLMLLYTLASYLLLKRKVATAIPLGKRIKQSEFVDSPFVLGIFCPVVYLPFGMAEADMAHVLAHEKAHIRRRDHWWKPFGFLLLSIYWFNPVLWVAYILLCRDIEPACDERVIRDMETDDRRAYSRALLNCSVHRRRIAACPLAFGEVGVKARVKGVMNYKKPAFWVLLIALVVSVVVAVCFLTNPESAVPDTMTVVFFDRTMAHIEFHYDERFSDGGFWISDEFALETLRDGNWQELTRPAEKKASNEVVETASENADHDAWSILKWEEVYGRLPDGTYRIRKDIVNQNSDETEPLYVEFTIGGTAEEYITYSLEDITPTGANLYEHEDSEALTYNVDGFWLEALQDGKWVYLEPTEDIHSVLPKEKYYIHARIYPSSHIALDWSGLYGRLPDGTYRIAREITHTGDSDLRLGTVYAEFTVENTLTIWFNEDRDSEEVPRESGHTTVPGIDGLILHYSSRNQQEIIAYAKDSSQTILSGPDIETVVLTDLNGDGAAEICATVWGGSGLANQRVQVYDYVQNQRYELQSNLTTNDKLAVRNNRLVVLRSDDTYGNITDMGLLTLQDDGYGGGQYLRLLPLDDSFRQMQETVVCVDIWTRKQVCLSSGEELYKILNLLRNLEGNVQPASAEELEAVQKDGFYLSNIVVAYELGRKTIVFSENFDYVWESGEETGYKVSNPESLRQFVESITNGVRGQEVSGQPFATADAPWDWCSGISTESVESAQAHVCLNTYSYGSTSVRSSTNGWISYDTLEDLIRVLNEIPKEAFTPDKMVSKESYRSFFINQQTENSTISLIDGVNDLAIVIKYNNGKVTMLLTDEMEKVLDNSHTYLEPTQVWTVNDTGLAEFMLFNITSNPPVISYSVGAEYDWQAPLDFATDGFSLELRLLEGWEYEYVTNDTDSGIRCRPEGINDGWIYFSYWPEEYKPVEEDRYIVEGFYFGWKSYTSYADEDVRIPGGMSTYGQVWSYKRYDLDKGDYVVINEGADEWFAEYKDRIQDITTLSNITVE